MFGLWLVVFENSEFFAGDLRLKRVLTLRRFLLKAPGKIFILGKLSKVFTVLKT